MTTAPKQKISLLCPTRGRPHYLIPHLASIAETIAAPERLELFFYVDRDDSCAEEYQALFAESKGLGLDIIGLVGDRIGTPKAINVMAGQSAGDCLMISNDDLLFATKGWDLALDQVATMAPDGIFNAYFNDGYFKHTLSCFPIVGRAWYDALGYLAPVIFDHCNVDLWIHRVGAMLNRNYYLEDVKVEHRHFEDDASGNRFNWQVEGAPRRRLARDNAYFEIFERYMALDAGILEDVIAGRPSRFSSFKDLALMVAYST